jgi:hypothetical protein
MIALSKIIVTTALPVHAESAEPPPTGISTNHTSTHMHCMSSTTMQRDRPKPTHYDTDSFDIYVDNCASRSITNDLRDFVDTPVPSNTRIYGTNGVSDGTLMGTVRWSIEDDDGQVHDIVIPNTVYSKGNRNKLLSPQHWSQEVRDRYPIRNGTWCATLDDRIILFWKQQRYKRTAFLLPESTNVGVIRSAPGVRKYVKACSAIERDLGEQIMAMPTVIEDVSHHTTEYATDTQGYEGVPIVSDNEEESPEPNETQDGTQQETQEKGPNAGTMSTINLDIEGEDDMDAGYDLKFTSQEQEYLYWHNKLGHLSKSRMKQLSEKGSIPRYLAKMKKTPICAACMHGKATKTPWRTKSETRQAPKVVTKPGECVAVDQLESSTVGFIGQLKGFLTKYRYKYATVFVDQYSDYTYLHFHIALTSEETMKAKRAFEAHAESFGVRVERYHADNGRFQDVMFRNDCLEKGQDLSFCGVNAHFQNGRAERKIRDLQDMGRTSLLHAIRKWPSAVNVHLWPYAIRYANDVNNNVPLKGQQQAPIELFSGVEKRLHLRHFHPFGCPMYVLDSNLQANKRAGYKWKDRARLAIHLGFSNQHAKSVHLALSLSTGNVSPQYHCTFDDTFGTLEQYKLPESLWQQKAHLTQQPPEETNKAEDMEKGQASTPTSTVRGSEDQPSEQLHENVETSAPTEYDQEHSELEQTTPLMQTRSGRVSRPPKRLQDEYVANSALASAVNQSINQVTSADSGQKIVAFEALHIPTLSEGHGAQPLLALKSIMDPDTLYLHEARKEEDFPEFLKAMQQEMDDHTKEGHWKVILRSMVPKGSSILPAVWSLKRKRRIATREVYRHKARINLDGSKQIPGLHYDETYSPVVSWSTTRFFLVQSLLRNWSTKQLDFVMAFPQAPVERDLYMELPKGVRLEGVEGSSEYVLQILKNLYGQKQAGRVWYQYLVKGLHDIGFTRSSVDECVFYYKKSVLLVYVDDSILMGPDDKELSYLMREMSKRFKIQEEGDLCDYLGIEVKRNKDGSISLTQPQLIDSILKDLSMSQDNVKARRTPSLKTRVLHKDEEGTSFDNSFHYRSIIGKLNYLEKCTRPDLSYAVHQCARFSSNPKQSHALAVKYIARYLAGTREDGIVMKPMQSGFECYVDASHAGDWKQQSAIDDPSTARSRTGYVIRFANCPLVWASKLQTEIALSTTEAEYIALSTSTREILPLLAMAKEAAKLKIISRIDPPVVLCKIFEDNQGAVEMANVPKMRPRTKHLNIKYHFFRQFVTKGILQVLHIAGEDQMADIFTKPLDLSSFVKHRRSITGW